VHVLLLLLQGEGGYTAVAAFVKKGSKAVEMLSDYMTERAKIEEEYAKSLQKLLKKSHDITEYGGLDRVWMKARSEMESESTAHLSFAGELKTAGAAVASVAKDIKKQSKSHLETAERMYKEHKTLHKNITSSQEKYNNTCKNNEKIDQEVAAAAGNPKNLGKAQQKQVKGQQDAAKAQQEYQAAVQKLQQFQTAFEEKVASSLDMVQELEIQRTDSVKNGWGKLETSMRFLVGVSENFTKSIAGLVKDANPKSDLQDWILSNKTATSPPPAPQFVPYGQSAPAASSSYSSPARSADPPRTTSAPSSGSSALSSSSSTRTFSPSKPDSSVPPPPPVPSGASKSSSNAQEEYAQEEYGEEEYAEEEYAEEEYAEEEYGEVVTATWDYTAEEENELSFKAGEQITIVSKDDPGWWTGTNAAGETGMFPSNYVGGEAE
jgi:myosin heavy subunit